MKGIFVPVANNVITGDSGLEVLADLYKGLWSSGFSVLADRSFHVTYLNINDAHSGAPN
jgi:hypothetical protein